MVLLRKKEEKVRWRLFLQDGRLQRGLVDCGRFEKEIRQRHPTASWAETVSFSSLVSESVIRFFFVCARDHRE